VYSTPYPFRITVFSLNLSECAAIGIVTTSWHKQHSDFRPNKFRAIVNLKQGWNKLLIKVEGAWGHWKASCRLVHQDGLPFEDVELGT